MVRRILLDHEILSLLNDSTNPIISNVFDREELFTDIDFKNISSSYDINQGRSQGGPWGPDPPSEMSSTFF